MSDTLKDDTWIAANSQIAPEKLHALGVVSYRWNIAEASLKSLLIAVTRSDFAIIWAIIHDIGDVAISTSITEILGKTAWPKPVADAILHGLKLYEANRINRNQLTHYLPSSFVGVDLARLKGPDFNPEPIPNDVTDLRRVADDIGRLLEYIGTIISIIYSRQYAGNANAILPPLPDTIPLPERLWKPPPPNPQGRKGSPGKAPG
jgi:hypothetical protein